MKKTQKVVRIHPRKKPNLTMPVCPDSIPESSRQSFSDIYHLKYGHTDR